VPNRFCDFSPPPWGRPPSQVLTYLWVQVMVTFVVEAMGSIEKTSKACQAQDQQAKSCSSGGACGTDAIGRAVEPESQCPSASTSSTLCRQFHQCEVGLVDAGGNSPTAGSVGTTTGPDETSQGQGEKKHPLGHLRLTRVGRERGTPCRNCAKV